MSEKASKKVRKVTSKNWAKLLFKCRAISLSCCITNSYGAPDERIESLLKVAIGNPFYDIGCFLKRFSINAKKKWRWPSRKIKIWYKNNNDVVLFFCIKIFFKSWFVWLVWPFECLILMILTMTKYHENLLRDSPCLCIL